ncbi:hypothetical protein T06_9119 [Trichinella sp. T6]|nr:hypothetical protein T06_9119 [Trichinella sp. T6]
MVNGCLMQVAEEEYFNVGNCLFGTVLGTGGLFGTVLATCPPNVRAQVFFVLFYNCRARHVDQGTAVPHEICFDSLHPRLIIAIAPQFRRPVHRIPRHWNKSNFQ